MAAASGGFRLPAGAWLGDRRAAEAKPTPAGNRGPGLAHLRNHPCRDFAAAGASEEGFAAVQENGMTPRAALERGLEELELALPACALDQLVVYLTLLAKWNRSSTLPPIRNPTDMALHPLRASPA